MIELIETRAFYGGWKAASREKAAAFAKWLLRNMPNVKSEAEKMEIANEKHLRGATVQELTNDRDER